MHYGHHTGSDLLGDISTRSATAKGLKAAAFAPSASLRPSSIPTDSVKWKSDEPRQPTLVATLPQSDEERAFDHLVGFKVKTANVAMHLDDDWRAGFFRQLDNMLDAEAWDFGDSFPSLESFNTFLRLIIHNKVKRRPGLGATTDGKLIAAWTNGSDRLTVECLADDTVRWVATKTIKDGQVMSANTSPVQALRTFLAPYQPDEWFG